VICSVIAAGEELLLDAIPREGILPYDHLPLEDLNYTGLKIISNGTEWIEIPFSDDSKSQALIELDFASRKGKMKLRYMGYPAAEKRYELLKGNEIFQKVIFENFTGEEIQVKPREIQNADKLEKSLEIDYDLDLVDISGLDIIYFNPAIWTDWKQAPFKKADRTLPVELPYPFIDQVAIKILLPEGYRLEEAPKGVRLLLPDSLGYFYYSISNEQDHILVNMRLKISGVYMSSEVYFHLKEFFEQISQKVNEVLVFGKQ
jgi:hypothetical protein